jgi:hypothetical protein
MLYGLFLTCCAKVLQSKLVAANQLTIESFEAVQLRVSDFSYRLFLTLILVSQSFGEVAEAQSLETFLTLPANSKSINHIDISGTTIILGQSQQTLWIGDTSSKQFEKVTWPEVRTSDYVNFVRALNPDTLFASVGPYFKRSFDRGQSWEIPTQGLYGVYDLERIGPSSLLATTTDGVHRSEDLGSTWSEANPQIEYYPGSQPYLHRLTDSLIVAASVYGQEGTFYHEFWSWNLGSTWADSIAIAIRQGGIEHSASDGQTAIFVKRWGKWQLNLSTFEWSGVSAPGCQYIESSVGAFFCRSGYSTYRSIDSGESWTEIELSGLYPTSLKATTPDSLFIGTKQGLFLARDLRPVGVSDQDSPQYLDTCHSFPNPFHSSVLFCIPRTAESEESVPVFNVIGRKVGQAKLSRCETSQCFYEWNSTDLPPGLYFVRSNTTQIPQNTIVSKVR